MPYTLAVKQTRFMENNVECIHLQYLEAADRVKTLIWAPSHTMLQASPQLKDKVQSGNAAASVLRVGS
jgi:hypothetical protein